MLSTYLIYNVVAGEKPQKEGKKIEIKNKRKCVK